MKLTLLQTADILNRSPDEVLYIANNEKRLTARYELDDDMIRNEDGTVSFKEGNEESTWWFDLDDVLTFKKQMDEGLAGKLEEILEGK